MPKFLLEVDVNVLRRKDAVVTPVDVGQALVNAIGRAVPRLVMAKPSAVLTTRKPEPDAVVTLASLRLVRVPVAGAQPADDVAPVESAPILAGPGAVPSPADGDPSAIE